MFENEYLPQHPHLRVAHGGKSKQGEPWIFAVCTKKKISEEERRLGIKVWSTAMNGVTDAELHQLAASSVTEKHLALKLRDIIIQGKSYDEVCGKQVDPLSTLDVDGINKLVEARVAEHLRLRAAEIHQEQIERIQAEAVKAYVAKAMNAPQNYEDVARKEVTARAIAEIGRKPSDHKERKRKEATVAIYRERARELGWPDWETKRINGGVMKNIDKQWAKRIAKDEVAEILKTEDPVPGDVEQAVEAEVRNG